MFYNYHVHTDYSVLDGFEKSDEVIDFALEHNQPAVCKTDHGTMNGYYQFHKKAIEKGLKPLTGIEFYAVDDTDEKERPKYHITAIAKSWSGLQSLFRLTYESAQKFYYKPRVDDSMLFEYGNDIIVSTACMGGKLPQLLINGEINKAKRWVRKYKKHFGDDFYIEIHLNMLKEQIELNRKLYDIAVELDVPVLIASDAHYKTRKDAKYHRTFMAIQTNNRFEFDSNDFYLKTEDEAIEILEKHGFNSDEIEHMFKTHNSMLDKVEAFDIKPFEDVVPIAYPGVDSEKLIWELIEKGAREKGFWDKPEYVERLKYEMKFINELGFIDYFLVVRDIYDFAKREKIAYGFGRGSSAGSLVCYALDITQVDPIKYNLLFHRFISPNRVTHPDIDMDFEDENRYKIFKYFEDKYGKECAVKIGTTITMKAKQAVRDTGRALKIPTFVVENINKYVIQRSGGDARASMCVMDTFTEFKEVRELLKNYPQMKEYAPLFEGRVRSVGKHAAGMVVVPKPIWNYTATEVRQGEMSTSVDYRDLDAQNLLKFDVLGLNTLTRLKKACELIGMEFDDILHIDYDDRKVLEAFSYGDNIGIFQFESKGMTDVCKQIPPEMMTFETLSALNALYRPSTMRSGITGKYIDRLLGKEKVEKLHEIYDEICKDTFGFPIYQEQVMQIFNKMAGFSAVDTDATRKKIAKSHGVEELERLRPDFVKGCEKNGIDSNIANKAFDTILFFGSYGFNKSHAVAYTMLSYATQYIKQYHTHEFYIAWLNVETEKLSIAELLYDAQQHNIKVLPPKLNKSRSYFKLENGSIRCGLKFVDSLGEKACKKYDKYVEKHGKIESYGELHKAKVFNSRQVDILYTIDALHPSDKIRDLNKLIQFYPYPAKSVFIKSLNSAVEKYKKKYKITRYKDIDFESPSEELIVPGLITNITYNKIGDFPWDNTKRWEIGSMYAVLDVEDGENHWRIKLNPNQYEKNSSKLQIGRYALFRVNKWQNVTTSLGWNGALWLDKQLFKKVDIEKYNGQ